MTTPELPGVLALVGLAALGFTVVCLLAALVTATAALVRRGHRPLADARHR